MKTILITGASRGIGFAIAKKFADSGYNVFAHYNKNKISLNNVTAVQADFSNANEIERMAGLLPHVDILINNAGIAQQKLFTDTDLDDYINIFDINFKSIVTLTRLLLPSMISKKSGKIINISSIFGITGASCEALYSASKAAVIGFSKSLAKELGQSGITVNCIAPGVIDTDMNANLSEEDMKEIIDNTPVRRLGTPDDIADCAFYLANADFVTGQVIFVDGGYSN